MKICKTCLKELPDSAFYVDKRYNCYFKNCKLCHNIKTKHWRFNNPKKVKDSKKKYRLNNPEKVSNGIKQWVLNNPEKSRRIKNHWIIKNTNKINNHYNERRKTDFTFRLIRNYRSRINIALKIQGVKKSIHTIDNINCTAIIFQKYLQSLFQPNMTLLNDKPKKWHVHHLLSICSVDLRDIEQQKKVFHYTNCVPMWEDNHKKFHQRYGYKTTKEQYNEFIKSLK